MEGNKTSDRGKGAKRMWKKKKQVTWIPTQVKRKRNKKETGEHGVSSPSFSSNQSSHVQS